MGKLGEQLLIPLTLELSSLGLQEALRVTWSSFAHGASELQPGATDVQPGPADAQMPL